MSPWVMQIKKKNDRLTYMYMNFKFHFKFKLKNIYNCYLYYFILIYV